MTVEEALKQVRELLPRQQVFASQNDDGWIERGRKIVLKRRARIRVERPHGKDPFEAAADTLAQCVALIQEWVKEQSS